MDRHQIYKNLRTLISRHHNKDLRALSSHHCYIFHVLDRHPHRITKFLVRKRTVELMKEANMYYNMNQHINVSVVPTHEWHLMNKVIDTMLLESNDDEERDKLEDMKYFHSKTNSVLVRIWGGTQIGRTKVMQKIMDEIIAEQQKPEYEYSRYPIMVDLLEPLEIDLFKEKKG